MPILTEAMISHQLDLLRVEAGVRAQVFRLLDGLRTDIVTRLQRTNITGYSRNRLNTLIDDIQSVITDTYTQAEGAVDQALLATARATARAAKDAVEQYLSVDMSIGLPPAATMSALVRDTVIMGAPSA